MTYSTYTPQCVLITGATGGFGKAFSEKFAEAGCKLILHGRNAEKLDALCAGFDVPTHPLLFDICDKPSTIEQINSIPEEFQDIDVLINNAGGALGLDKIHRMPILEDLETMVEMNNTSLVRITRLIVLAGMAQAKTGPCY